MHTCNSDRVFRGPSEAQEHDMVVDFTHEVAKKLEKLKLPTFGNNEELFSYIERENRDKLYLSFKCDYRKESIFVEIPSIDFGIFLPVKDLKKVKTKLKPDGYLIKAINEGEDLIRQIRSTIKSKINTAITLDEV